MNLLIDQDDQQHMGQQPEEPVETPKLETPKFAEQEGPIFPIDADSDVYRFDRDYVRKKSVVGPIVVIAILLMIIVVAAYFSFFYRSKEFVDYTPVENRKTAAYDSVPTATTLSPAKSTEVLLPSPDSQAPKEAMTTNNIPQRENALKRAAKILAEILKRPAEDIEIGTVIIDENSFSVEISSRSRSAIERYFAELKAKLNGELSFSPATGNYSGVRALIIGTFQPVLRDKISKEDSGNVQRLQQTLSDIAKENGLKVIEVSSEKSRFINGSLQTPLFLKLSGKEDQFYLFCDKAANSLKNVSVAKIIVMFSGKQTATFVLRLEIIQNQ